MNKVSSPTVWHWAWDGPPFIFQLQSIIWKYKLTFSWILKVLCHQGQWADAFRNGSQIRNELCWHSYPPLDGGKTASILEPAWPLDAEGSYSSDGKQDSGLSGESLDICIILIFFFKVPSHEAAGPNQKESTSESDTKGTGAWFCVTFDTSAPQLLDLENEETVIHLTVIWGMRWDKACGLSLQTIEH